MTATLDSSLPPAAAPTGAAFGHRLMPPGDPLAGAAFEEIYEAQIKPALIQCEAGRKKAVWIFLGAFALAVALVAAIFLLTPIIFDVQASFGLMAFIFGAIVLIGYVPLAGVGAAAKTACIRALCGPIGIDYQPSGKTAPSFDTFLTLRLLPKPSSTYFSDFFSGRRGEIDFSLCEARLSQGEGKNRHTVFEGQIFRLAATRRLDSTTVVLRNSGWLKRFECPQGLRPVGLEDPVFNKTFSVFGSDQVEARVILTPSFMQQLNDLEAGYAGSHIRCAFEATELLIAVEGRSRFGIGNLFANLVDRSRVEHIARDIEQVFKMIDEFA
jgi:hypothetical protein